ncbi:MAG: hypothetical protein OHK006_12830 [Thermodesulfovibrionales bacterium]
MTMSELSFVRDLRTRIRRAIADDIKHARNKEGRKMHRREIAEGMTAILGEIVTVASLNNWTAKSHVKHRFPIEYLPAFVAVTGQKRALFFFIETMVKEMRIDNEIAGIEQKIFRLTKKKERLEALRNEIV